MAMMYTVLPLRVAYSPLFDGGDHQITGTTSNTGTPDLPVRRRVRLHDQRSGRTVREVWSAAINGAYTFEKIRAGTYYVITFDHTGVYGAEAESDIVVPEPSP